MTIDEWVAQAWSLGASDLHLEAGTPVVARLQGELQTVGADVPAELLVRAAQDCLGATGWARFKERGSADLSLASTGVRCRVNFYQTVRVGPCSRVQAGELERASACGSAPKSICSRLSGRPRVSSAATRL